MDGWLAKGSGCQCPGLHSCCLCAGERIASLACDASAGSHLIRWAQTMTSVVCCAQVYTGRTLQQMDMSDLGQNMMQNSLQVSR